MINDLDRQDVAGGADPDLHITHFGVACRVADRLGCRTGDRPGQVHRDRQIVGHDEVNVDRDQRHGISQQATQVDDGGALVDPLQDSQIPTGPSRHHVPVGDPTEPDHQQGRGCGVVQCRTEELLVRSDRVGDRPIAAGTFDVRQSRIGAMPPATHHLPHQPGEQGDYERPGRGHHGGRAGSGR
ncbi:MAG TPA: hypothetical protein VIT42_08420 [Microlunatus sp.]